MLLSTEDSQAWASQLEGQDGLMPQDVIIVVMGLTGAGKSTFVRHVTGREDVAVGHSLKACTQDLRIIRMDHPDRSGRRLVMVDTQGFDDDQIKDADVLEKMANWMADTYNDNVKLSGILYFHKISDNRMGGRAAKNLRLFKELVGEGSMSNVVLVTTMWGLVDEATGVERERELLESTSYWEGMVTRGAQHARFLATPESGRRIIGLLDGRPPVGLQIQNQMVTNGLAIGDTLAGMIVANELERMRLEQEQMLADLREEYDKALEEKDQRLVEQIGRERSASEAKLREILEKNQRLKEKPFWKNFSHGIIQVVSVGLVDPNDIF